MKPDDIINVLRIWNLWDKDIEVGIPRDRYVDELSKYLDMKHILILKGVRRCGKTTIAKQLMKNLLKKKIKKKQILYVNFEDMNFADKLQVQLLDEILYAYLEFTKNKEKIYCFLDELQRIPNWEIWIRTKYDQNQKIKFIITGSSAHLLDKELSTLLTGRNLTFEIMPLSFKEFKKFNKKGELEEYMKFGGFPEVVLEKSEERKIRLLNQYLVDILHRDIVDRYRIRNANELIAIAKYLVSTPGSKVSVNKLSKVFGLTKNTIASYISYMVDAYLLLEVRFFSFSAKVKYDAVRLPKYYVIDNGLVNITTTQYFKNLGQLYENTVLLKLYGIKEILKNIMYWSDGESEVDFVAGEKAINVTATDKIPAREWKGLEAFQKKHKRFSLLLVTKSINDERVISLKKFLEEGT
jgi:uncharacterized protein